MQEKEIQGIQQKVEELKAVFSFGVRFVPFLEDLLAFVRDLAPKLEELSQSPGVSAESESRAPRQPEQVEGLLRKLAEISEGFAVVSRRLEAEREVTAEITEGIEKLLKLPEARKKLSKVFEDQQARDIGVQIKSAVDRFLSEKVDEALLEKVGGLIQEAGSDADGLQSVLPGPAASPAQLEAAKSILNMFQERLGELIGKYSAVGTPDFIRESLAGPPVAAPPEQAGAAVRETEPAEMAAAEDQLMPGAPEQAAVIAGEAAEMPESKAFEEETEPQAAGEFTGEIPENIPEEMERVEEEVVEANQEELNELLDWGSDAGTPEVAGEQGSEPPAEEETALEGEAPTLDEQVDAELEAAQDQAGEVVGEIETSVEDLLAEAAVSEEEPPGETLEEPLEAGVEGGEVIGEVQVSVEELFAEDTAQEEAPAGETMEMLEEAGAAAEESETAVSEEAPPGETLEEPMEAGIEGGEVIGEVQESVEELFAEDAALEEATAEEVLEEESGMAVEEEPPGMPAGEEPGPKKGGNKTPGKKSAAEEPLAREAEDELSISQDEIDKLFQ